MPPGEEVSTSGTFVMPIVFFVVTMALISLELLLIWPSMVLVFALMLLGGMTALVTSLRRVWSDAEFLYSRALLGPAKAYPLREVANVTFRGWGERFTMRVTFTSARSSIRFQPPMTPTPQVLARAILERAANLRQGLPPRPGNLIN